MSLLLTVPPNLVQSIRAFRVTELQDEAIRLGQHFLYAHCNAGQTKQQVIGIIAEAFLFPKNLAKNFDALRLCLTDTMFKAGTQTGFLVVLEQLPNTQKFDKEGARDPARRVPRRGRLLGREESPVPRLLFVRVSTYSRHGGVKPAFHALSGRRNRAAAAARQVCWRRNNNSGLSWFASP